MNGRLVWTLFILDSNNRAYYVVEGKEKTCEDHIRHDQIMWYRHTSDAIKNAYGDIPALAFFHIPIPEFTDAWLFEHCLGDRFEHVTSATVNSGFFSAALKQGDIKGIFVGHDHTNSYSADIFGIKLAYGRCTSYHCNLGDFPRGGRIILLKDQSFETYNLLHIRPENRVEENIAVYRQVETLSAPYFSRFNFCLPLNRGSF